MIGIKVISLCFTKTKRGVVAINFLRTMLDELEFEYEKDYHIHQSQDPNTTTYIEMVISKPQVLIMMMSYKFDGFILPSYLE